MATVDAPTPIPGRASEQEREQVARLLRKRSIDGSISTDTFAARVGRAARSRAELDDLVADVRRPGPAKRVALRERG